MRNFCLEICRLHLKKDMSKVVKEKNTIINEVPSQVNDGDLLYYLQKKEVNSKHINAIRSSTQFNDDTIAQWLNISVRTFRDYGKSGSTFKENLKEHVLLLLSLMKHGAVVFGSPQEFDRWLDTENFYFDKKKPSFFLNTITGIRFVDDRLIAMEYGDNV